MFSSVYTQIFNMGKTVTVTGGSPNLLVLIEVGLLSCNLGVVMHIYGVMLPQHSKGEKGRIIELYHNYNIKKIIK